MEEITAKYTIGDILGQGGFGKVYAAVRKEDGREVAIKYVEKNAGSKYMNLPGETRRLPLEVALMQMVSRPPGCEYVLELLEWFDLPGMIALVLERPSSCMDLSEFCRQKNGRLSESQARHIMRQVVQAAQHCCDRGVLHRDIKPQNLLINTDTMVVKLIDFGCGDVMRHYHTRFPGTLYYRPPEWILNKRYQGRPATVWSLGVLLFYLVCGHVPFWNNFEITRNRVPIDRSLSQECKELILQCLEKDPLRRPTLENINRHRWLTEELHS